MIAKTLSISVAAALAIVAFAGRAGAQTFPADDRWSALPCGTGVMVDGHRDQSGALDERDIVGDTLAPAGYRASDTNFVYLRMRVDGNPISGKSLRPFAWGFEFDLDANRSTYELLVILRGSDQTIAVHRNTTTTLPNDPADPADDPPVITFPFSTHGRSLVAPGSRYGGNDDYFVDLAVPWTTLEPLGLTRTTSMVAWVATSSAATNLNGDFACHDGATGGAPRLSTIAPQPTALDPFVDTDGDGWTDAVEIASGTDPRNPASHPGGTPPPPGGAPVDPVLEGAGGCSFDPASTSVGDRGYFFGFAVLLTSASILASRRRRRR